MSVQGELVLLSAFTFISAGNCRASCCLRSNNILLNAYPNFGNRLHDTSPQRSHVSTLSYMPDFEPERPLVWNHIPISLFVFFLVALTLEHRAFVKRFVSLQFLNLGQ
jgi:hypothetical protein